ncbi:hypothetical protein VHEMI05505 [[Torrubiella] hemipterigena]|uniref:Cupin type-2 domain-containing protein n=2 Tax=[Torrubiella] hemipterigena TaxID=1531966 RepID=A0A0A1THA4_9HYPO|nr:hypothetical protein VHEMI05505 [[Torrubiella] hemipterigena]
MADQDVSALTLLKTLTVGKGQTMEIYVDESQPEDSIYRYTMDTISTGEEDLVIPPHWHKHHQEHFSVLQGKLEVTVNGKMSILNVGDEPMILERGAVHSMKAYKGEPVIFRERPDPPGIYKAIFFNDMFAKGGFPGVLHALRAFYDGDGYMALPFGSRLLDEIFISLFGGMAHLFVEKRAEEL